MSNLRAFLKPLYTEKTVEVIVSDRFADDDGNPIPFKLKTLTQETLVQISKRSMKEQTIGGRRVQEMDRHAYLNRCLVESCIQPDFKDRELCIAYGTEDPLNLPQKMLLGFEYERLGRAFLDLHGLSEDSPELGEVTKK